MQLDPTRYRLHDGTLGAIDYNSEQQQLILHLEYNLALEVNYDPDSPDDDSRQTRLIFTGLESISPELAYIAKLSMPKLVAMVIF
ncbi:hypothetical protein ACP8Y2_11245 [Herpetosiphon llansteffanensis]